MTSEQKKILVVDDEFSVRDSLQHWFRKDGYDVELAENGHSALQALERKQFDVALVDIKMPGMDGLELQQRLHQLDPSLPVIMITAFASVDTAITALKHGSFDYVTKPVDPDELSHLVGRALEQRRLETENVQLRGTIDDLVTPDPIIGQSPEMRHVLQLVQRVAPTDSTVLIRGESGTGKELIARAIHDNSPRRYFPLVPVNCGSLPQDILESELFGHERGAFTGAQYRHKGKIEMADKGTLFLDEVGAIPPRMQIDLLRVLETKELTRLGSSRPISVDFRIICATNEDLEAAVREGRFREDFYYRINVFVSRLPPLRERKGDIPLLAEHFREKLSRQMERRITGFEPAAMDLLQSHHWPGNVRELSNAIERAMVVGKPPLVRAADLPIYSMHPESAGGDSLSAVEHRHIASVLERTDGNITRAAEILGVDRVTVYNKIKKYGLKR